MTLIQIGQLGALVIAVWFLVHVVPGYVVRLSRRFVVDDLHIPPFNVKVKYDKADESLPAAAALRRAQAETLRRASLRVLSNGEGR